MSLSSSSSNGNISDDYRRRRGGGEPRPRSLSVSSSDDGSSIDIPTNRRGQRTRASICHGAGGRLFTQSEDRVIATSLRKKLLANDGKRLNRIERHLLRATNRNSERAENGWVSVAAFEDALAADGKANRGRSAVTRDEALWLSEKLESCSGKKIACLRIRSLLVANDEEGLEIRGSKGRGRGRENGGDRGWRRRVDTSTGATQESSDSDTWEHDSGGACSIRRRQDGVARWAVRRGTVGEWLQEVASPMVSIANEGLFSSFKLSQALEHPLDEA